MKASIKVGGSTIELSAEYLDQQTAISSVFDGIELDAIPTATLIEANKVGIAWYKRWIIGTDQKCLHISVPNELISWEE